MQRALPLLSPEAALRWQDVQRAFVVGPKTAAVCEQAFVDLQVQPPGGAHDADALCTIVSTAGASSGGISLLQPS